MPLTPLPADNTPRVAIRYTSGGFIHEAQLRTSITSVTSDLVDLVTVWANTLQPLVASTDNIVDARFWASGSNIYVPVPLTGRPGTGAAATPTPFTNARYLDFTGRALSGRKTKTTLFLQDLGDIETFRTPLSAFSPDINAYWEFLVTNEPAFDAVDGTPVVWKSYYNNGVNAHYQKIQRG